MRWIFSEKLNFYSVFSDSIVETTCRYRCRSICFFWHAFAHTQFSLICILSIAMRGLNSLRWFFFILFLALTTCTIELIIIIDKSLRKKCSRRFSRFVLLEANRCHLWLSSSNDNATACAHYRFMHALHCMCSAAQIECIYWNFEPLIDRFIIAYRRVNLIKNVLTVCSHSMKRKQDARSLLFRF